MTSSTPSSTTTKPSVIWTTYSFTPPLSQTIGESPERYSRPSIPTSYSSDWRNASSNIKRWTTLGLLSPRPKTSQTASSHQSPSPPTPPYPSFPPTHPPPPTPPPFP